MAGSGPTPPPVITPVFYDYLVFDGVAIVQTDYVLPSNCSIACAMGWETQKVAQQVFLAGGNGNISLFIGGGTNTTRRQMVALYDSDSYIKTANLNWSYASYTFFMTPSRFGWGNTANTYTKGNKHPTGGISFGEAGNTSAPRFTGRFGTIKIYGSEASGVTTYNGFASYTPVATFRPCTYDNVPGFWHEESSTFYGNTAGAGTLTVLNS